MCTFLFKVGNFRMLKFVLNKGPNCIFRDNIKIIFVNIWFLLALLFSCNKADFKSSPPNAVKVSDHTIELKSNISKPMVVSIQDHVPLMDGEKFIFKVVKGAKLGTINDFNKSIASFEYMATKGQLKQDLIQLEGVSDNSMLKIEVLIDILNRAPSLETINARDAVSGGGY